MEALNLKAGLKCVLVTSGLLSVMTTGTIEMLVWCVKSSSTQTMVCFDVQSKVSSLALSEMLSLTLLALQVVLHWVVQLPLVLETTLF